MSLTRDERIARLDAMIAEGRIVRREWRGRTVDGRETACLLVALSPEAGDQGGAACPSWLLPGWFALLVPSIDDCGSEAAWTAMVRRFASLMHRAHVLTADDWQALDWQCRAIAVREARSHVPDGDAALPAIDRVLELLDRRGGASEERREAAEAADAAVWAVAAVVWTALSEAEEAVTWTAAKAAEWAVAVDASWDRMTEAWFDAIEAACARREVAQ